MGKISVFSGEDIISSRKAFLERLESLKNDNLEVVRVAGRDLSEESLALLSSSSTLFGQNRALAIDNLLSGQKSKDKEKTIISVSALPCEVVIWENKDFGKTDQLKYPSFIFKNFKLPQAIFIFLDSFFPNNAENNLKLFRQANENTDTAFIFLMLIRQIRLLILAKSEKNLLKMAPWQISKIERQSKMFSLEKLREINQKLLFIDHSQKTSAVPFSLREQLELFLSEI